MGVRAVSSRTPADVEPPASIDTPRPSAARVRLNRALLQGRGWTVVRLITDLIFLELAVQAARIGLPASVSDDGQVLVQLLPPLTVAALAARHMYRGELQVRVIDGLGTLVAAVSLVSVALISAAAFIEPTADPAPLVARTWLFALVYVTGVRFLLAWTQRQARASGLIGKPTLIVGAGRVGALVERRLRQEPELGLRPLGYLDADPPPEALAPGRQAPILGAPGELAEVASRLGVRHVVLGFSSAPDSELLPLVRECEARGLEISLVPRLFESVNVRVDLQHIGGLPLFGLRSVDPKGWQFAIKHGLDRVIAAAAVVALAPLLLVIAAAVMLSSPGPVFFRQRRIGRDGRDFDMLKFRSMRADQQQVPATAMPLLDDPDLAPGGVEGEDRRTRIGALLRTLSLDELPQLFNVLGGQMSLVGPRPERPEFVELFGRNVSRYDDRHRVKSGITGWAQIHGLRGKTSVSDRIEMDNYYISNWSLGLDAKIIVRTVAAIFKGSE